MGGRSHFDPLKPTSLLYKKKADGGYKLVGVMYTDRVDATEDELNERIPLSIARWHQHINFCKAPKGRRRLTLEPTLNLDCSAPLPRKKHVRRQAASFVRTCLDGWFTCTRMRQIRGRSGQWTMTTRGTTTWTTPLCRG